MAARVWSLMLIVFLQFIRPHRAQPWTVDTLVSLRNNSAFTFIDKHSSKPGLLVAILSHAIVEVNATSGEMRLVAGLPNSPGYRNGIGPFIRFNHPRSIAQVNGSTWIIADSNNNCLRTFYYNRNSFSYGSSISDWSSSCNQFATESNVRTVVSSSTFYRPRGLKVEGRRIYITYAKSYSLTVIYPENGRVEIEYESTFWNLQQMVVFQDEIFLSTGYKELLLSYRDKQLGRVLSDNQKHDILINENSISDVAFIKSDTFVVTRSEENVLAFIHQQNNTIVRVCTGNRGYGDGEHLICMLNQPQCVVKVNDVLYIGEYGSSGGGLRTIGLKKDSPDEKDWVIPTSVTIAVVVMATIIGIIIFICKRRQPVSPNRIVRQLRHSVRQSVRWGHQLGRPLPAPRISGQNQHPTMNNEYTLPNEGPYISMLNFSLEATLESRIERKVKGVAKKPAIVPRRLTDVSYKPPDEVRKSDTSKSDHSYFSEYL